MNKGIEVSIFCLAYNHEKYIRDTLNGFIMQKTNFKYEVIIHDDASTDNTAKIIKEYADKYPEIIKPIFQTENQYSKGIPAVIKYVHPKLQGRYLALCEGDDCWIDPYKLQKQYDALENHPEYDMCTHKVEWYDSEINKVTDIFPHYSSDCIIPQEDVIYGGGGFLGTCSLFMRREVRLNMMEFQKFYVSDYTTQIRGSLRGGIVFLNEIMSRYRFRTNGSWTSNYIDNKVIQDEVNQKLIGMYEILDRETDYKYHDVIDFCGKQRKSELLISKYGLKALYSKEYHDIFEVLNTKERLNFIIRESMPFLIKPVRFIRKVRHMFLQAGTV